MVPCINPFLDLCQQLRDLCSLKCEFRLLTRVLFLILLMHYSRDLLIFIYVDIIRKLRSLHYSSLKSRPNSNVMGLAGSI